MGCMTSENPNSTVWQNLSWERDILGPDFQAATFALPSDPRDLGPKAPEAATTTPQATLVRYLPALENPDAVLWIHGMTDYFLQDHVACFLGEHGIATYGMDLRRCGRSHREGELWHHTLDLDVYFTELTQALEIMLYSHRQVIPMAHSTGGLIGARWVAWLAANHPEAHACIPGVLLNSPWLDMQGPQWPVRAAIQLALQVGQHAPYKVVPAGVSQRYGESLHASCQGRWNYDLNLKPLGGHEKNFGWLRAVLLAQREIHEGKVDTRTPVLTLCSDHSTSDAEGITAKGDAVLDVIQIRSRTPLLGHSTRVEVIPDAAHDVFLSEQAPLEQAQQVTLEWLQQRFHSHH